MYQIKISNKAAKQLPKLDKSFQNSFLEEIDKIATDPREGKPLKYKIKGIIPGELVIIELHTRLFMIKTVLILLLLVIEKIFTKSFAVYWQSSFRFRNWLTYNRIS
jgi:hypothetical protein